jgi:hypothetical protein
MIEIRENNMKKVMIALLVLASAAPALATDKGPGKKALAAMSQDERESCATAYLTFAFGSRQGTQMSVKRDGLSADDAKMHDKASDAFQLRGLQFLNANAKLSDPIPKAIDDAAHAPVERLLADHEMFEKNWAAMGSCNDAVGIEPIDMRAFAK